MAEDHFTVNKLNSKFFKKPCEDDASINNPRSFMYVQAQHCTINVYNMPAAPDREVAKPKSQSWLARGARWALRLALWLL